MPKHTNAAFAVSLAVLLVIVTYLCVTQRRRRHRTTLVIQDKARDGAQYDSRDNSASHEISTVRNPYSNSSLYWCTDKGFCKRNFPSTFDFDYDIKQHIVSHAMTLPRNFAIIDCGAHIGDGAIPIADALKVGGRADITVYAIDPSPEKCRFMRAMAELNGLENIKVLQCGLSDRDGDMYSHARVDNPNTGGTNWHTDSRDEHGNAIGEEAIEFARLDTLIKDGLVRHRIGYIHLDVESMEPHAVRGALNMFVTDRPILSAETHTDQHRADILDILQPHGYRYDRMLHANSLFIPG